MVQVVPVDGVPMGVAIDKWPLPRPVVPPVRGVEDSPLLGADVNGSDGGAVVDCPLEWPVVYSPLGGPVGPASGVPDG